MTAHAPYFSQLDLTFASGGVQVALHELRGGFFTGFTRDMVHMNQLTMAVPQVWIFSIQEPSRKHGKYPACPP